MGIQSLGEVAVEGVAVLLTLPSTLRELVVGLDSLLEQQIMRGWPATAQVGLVQQVTWSMVARVVVGVAEKMMV